MIFYSDCIQFFIINTEMKFSFKFLCKQNWKDDMKVIDLNKCFDQIFVKIIMKFLNLITTHVVQKCRWELKFFFQLNNKITNSMWEQNISFFFKKTFMNSRYCENNTMIKSIFFFQQISFIFFWVTKITRWSFLFIWNRILQAWFLYEFNIESEMNLFCCHDPDHMTVSHGISGSWDLDIMRSHLWSDFELASDSELTAWRFSQKSSILYIKLSCILFCCWSSSMSWWFSDQN